MRTTLVKWLCMVVLFLAFILWRSMAGYELGVRLVVCAGAVLVAVQAYRAARYSWAAGFLVIAVLFNPAIRAFQFAGVPGLLAIILAGALFAGSLDFLKSTPLLSMPSITDRTPGSESL